VSDVLVSRSFVMQARRTFTITRESRVGTEVYHDGTLCQAYQGVGGILIPFEVVVDRLTKSAHFIVVRKDLDLNRHAEAYVLQITSTCSASDGSISNLEQKFSISAELSNGFY